MQEAAVRPQIETSWKNALENEFQAPYFTQLKAFLVADRQQYTVYPPGKFIFNAFNLTPLTDVKVVILGQDPYHGPGQAHGLCFSVQDGVALPPSLRNIYKELNTDLGLPIATSGNLERWAKQGVLLLNATLTVRARQAGSHQKRGWEQFTDAAIKAVSDQCSGVVFILWGRFAQNKEYLIDQSKHHVLKSAHPSPFSADRGFFGCRHFSRANALLQQQGKAPVDWSVG